MIYNIIKKIKNKEMNVVINIEKKIKNNIIIYKINFIILILKKYKKIIKKFIIVNVE